SSNRSAKLGVADAACALGSRRGTARSARRRSARLTQRAYQAMFGRASWRSGVAMLPRTAVSGPFSPLVAGWVAERFGTPTPAQDVGWPRIAAGEDTLIAAPTGSGKTLAAFLWSIDRLVRLASAGMLEDRTHVVYVSPLKALGNDVQKNLLAPLAELRARAEGLGAVLPDVPVIGRSGATPPS